MNKPEVTSFFHRPTYTFTHVVADPDDKHCAIIDPVLDFDQASGRTRTEFSDQVLELVTRTGLEVCFILETHAHADHLSSATYLQAKTAAPIGIGEQISSVQTVFKGLFNEGDDLATDGSQFNRLLKDGEQFAIGSLTCEVLHTPGHTPACVSYRVGDAIFVGDTLFMPDYGTARADFPGGDAGTLYESIQRILALPDETRMFLCHDYEVPGREFTGETTVGAQKAGNIHIKTGVTAQAFTAFRNGRDKTLSMPQLILPSLQVNIRAGNFPAPEENGVSYLKLPLNQL
ncbi:MAG: MBL fold metallo-hydrolase [Gammaproteobacteria bacterium]|nr:MBL fold metallo-hydrolase [Gammaproteobacteria bacterium]